MQFIATGSSSYGMENMFSESLSGRKKVFELYPLTFGEFLTFRGVTYAAKDWRDAPFDTLEYARLSEYYEEYIRFGGFPQVVLAKSHDHKIDILKDIYSSYITIDIRTLADISNERNIALLARLLAERIGGRVEVSKLSQLTGMARQTITDYITLLEKTYLIRTIATHTANVDNQLVKAKKLYFCDTGIANIVTNLSSGAQFENTLSNQLAQEGSVEYFALKGGREIDFVVGAYAYEAKESTGQFDLAALARMARIARLERRRVITRTQPYEFDDCVWGGSIV